jgi:hypothetical protein
MGCFLFPESPNMLFLLPEFYQDELLAPSRKILAALHQAYPEFKFKTILKHPELARICEHHENGEQPKLEIKGNRHYEIVGEDESTTFAISHNKKSIQAKINTVIQQHYPDASLTSEYAYVAQQGLCFTLNVKGYVVYDLGVDEKGVVHFNGHSTDHIKDFEQYTKYGVISLYGFHDLNNRASQKTDIHIHREAIKDLAYVLTSLNEQLKMGKTFTRASAHKILLISPTVLNEVAESILPKKYSIYSNINEIMGFIREIQRHAEVVINEGDVLDKASIKQISEMNLYKAKITAIEEKQKEAEFMHEKQIADLRKQIDELKATSREQKIKIQDQQNTIKNLKEVKPVKLHKKEVVETRQNPPEPEVITPPPVISQVSQEEAEAIALGQKVCELISHNEENKQKEPLNFSPEALEALIPFVNNPVLLKEIEVIVKALEQIEQSSADPLKIVLQLIPHFTTKNTPISTSLKHISDVCKWLEKFLPYLTNQRQNQLKEAISTLLRSIIQPRVFDKINSIFSLIEEMVRLKSYMPNLIKKEKRVDFALAYRQAEITDFPEFDQLTYQIFINQNPMKFTQDAFNEWVCWAKKLIPANFEKEAVIVAMQIKEIVLDPEKNHMFDEMQKQYLMQKLSSMYCDDSAAMLADAAAQYGHNIAKHPSQTIINLMANIKVMLRIAKIQYGIDKSDDRAIFNLLATKTTDEIARKAEMKYKKRVAEFILEIIKSDYIRNDVNIDPKLLAFYSLVMNGLFTVVDKTQNMSADDLGIMKVVVEEVDKMTAAIDSGKMGAPLIKTLFFRRNETNPHKEIIYNHVLNQLVCSQKITRKNDDFTIN